MNAKPIIVVKVSGGRVQGVIASCECDFLVLDYDVGDAHPDDYEESGIRQYPEEGGSTDAAESYEEPPLVNTEYAQRLWAIHDAPDTP